MANIIGAMIVAPLMLPIMGLAFGISIGDTHAIKNSLLISLGGIAVSIAIGYLLTVPIGSMRHAINTDEVVERF